MAQCAAIIPLVQVTQVDREEVDPEKNDGQTYSMHDNSYLVPEHQCPNTATVVAVSMQQVECSYGLGNASTEHALHWLETERVVYCSGCALPGTMTHLSGQVTAHPIQALAHQ